MRVKISDVTLIAVSCVDYAITISSLRNCMNKCEFDRVIFLTDIDIKEEGIEVIKVDRINSKNEYSRFIIKELYKYFNTTHCLIVQHDGTILNPDCWDENFKKYDYIGAKWIYPDDRNVGNGGFSLRSLKLHYILGEDDFIRICSPEDEIISRLYRSYLEETYKIKFATEDVADLFSYELNKPFQKTFGHHGNFFPEFKEHIVLKRTAAMGDVVMLEPVIRYYCEKGYQVVLDTLSQFMELFKRYDYFIMHISEMDARIKPVKSINFDMAYENTPKQVVLKSYITLTNENISLSNSRLNYPVDKSVYLFDKLIVIHIDSTGMTYRDCHGINWDFVISYYQKLGYNVFQVGKRMENQVASYLNTSNIETLMFIISNADVVIGIDSSPTQIAVALGIPSVIFFGSVDPKLRYVNLDKIEVIHTPCPINSEKYCYHEVVGVSGKSCEINNKIPPCAIYSEYEVIKSVNKFLNKKNGLNANI